MAKWVYMFTEGNANMRNLLGGKGANLAEMTNLGLPVPQGFTITTEACTQYYEDGRQINDEIMAQIMEAITKMEGVTGKKFGDKENPLLVSVRSGARASMPGMMDTILNLGLNEDVVNVLAEKSGNARWAWDCYRRFIQMYSDVVMEVGKKYFEELIDEMKAKRGVKQDVELTAEDLHELAEQFKAEYKAKIGADFPTDPKEQLMGAIKAVFRSWDNPRANVYRRDNDIPYSWGTAVNVQMMAFGNMGDDCGTGVAFTRDPATGANGLFGEFLTNAQGEDVVAGVRTPMHISEMEQKFPEAFVQFKQVCETLEKHYRDMQDMEFTVEHGKLYMLQTRNGKRTAQAALKIACDLVDEGMRTEEEAVAMIDPRNLDTLLHPQFDAAALKAATPMGKGLGASPGAACGKIVFTADDAVEWAERGEKVVLVRLETSPEDITGMKSAQGILTVRGGMTSHAAVVARGMGECCVSGCGDIAMDEENKKFTLAGKEFHEGDFISIDGTTGNIYDGIIPTVDATIAGEFGRIMAWADKYRTMKVRTNADTPADAKKAVELGAEGIGLCRTEHMFFGEGRIDAFREMICSETAEEREKALEKFFKCFLSLFCCFGADHFTECIDTSLTEEHMLCTAKTDTFCAKLYSFLSICRSICVCTNFHCSVLVSPCHDASELTSDCSVYSRDDSVVDVTGCTIDGDEVSFVEFFTSKCEFLVFFVHSDITASGYTALTHTTGNNCCVRCHTTTNCQDTLSRFHTCDVFRRCLKTYKYDFLSSFSPFNSVISCEYDLTASSSRRSAKAFTHWCSSFQSSSIKLWVKKSIKVTWVDHSYSFFFCSHSLINKVTSDL